MSVHTFYQLDVFTDRALAGNPLAVFPEAQGMTGQTMQAVAREMNLSETAFVTPSQRAMRRVRFFTPSAEIPLAGHPTIGTWWLLAELGVVDLPANGVARVTQESDAGVIPVDIQTLDGKPSHVSMLQTLPEFGVPIPSRDALSEAIGGTHDSVAATPAAQVVSTALPQMMIPISSLERLQALPSGGTGGVLARFLADHGTACAMCYALPTAGSAEPVRCRMFAPGLGVPEDPATGSAAGALGAYLVRHGVIPLHNGKLRIVVEQGIEIGRPSRIHVAVAVGNGGDITEVRVGGTAVSVIRGELTL